MKKLKKTLSLFLTVCMLVGSISVTAFADEPQAENITSENNDTSKKVQTESDAQTENTTSADNDASGNMQTEPDAQTEGENEADIAPQSTTAVNGYDYSITMVDCGRKYYSVESLKSIIDSSSEAGMHYVMLAIGNDGLRFLLDDMSLEVNGKSYTSEQVSTGIHKGNVAYNSQAVQKELKESEMNTIMAYAYTKGVEIIPLINTPGHMDAIITCMKELGMTNVTYSTSKRTIDVTNSEAVAFTQALLQKYIRYFASKGCTLFNMGADEYGNDVNGTPHFSDLQANGGDKYKKYIEYLNAVAKKIENASMKPMAFNDGIYYSSNTNYGTIDNSIIVCYWSPGWQGYDVASAGFLSQQGFKLINTHGGYYWIVGGTKVTESDAKQFNINSFNGGATISNPAGAMFCIWSDVPTAQTDSDVASSVKNVISAFGSTLPKTTARDSHKNVTAGGTDPTPTPTPNPNPTPDVENQENITLEIGGTYTRTQENVNNQNNTDTSKYDETIAKVTVKGTDATEGEDTYIAEKVTCKDIAKNKNWTKTEYYYNDNGNYYPVYTRYSESTFIFIPITKYYYGYSTNNNANNVKEIGSTTTSSEKWTLYRKTTTPGVNASTEIKFEGVTPGTTYYKVGDITYKIEVKPIAKTENKTIFFNQSQSLNVQVPDGCTVSYAITNGNNLITVDNNGNVTAGSKEGSATVIATVKTASGTVYGTYTYNYTIAREDLTNVTPLKLEYWITNAGVKVEGTSSETRLNTNGDNYSVYYSNILASTPNIASADGVDVTSIAPKTTAHEERTIYYWRARALNTELENNSSSKTERQTNDAGDDETFSGTGFTKIRYYNGEWEIFTENNSWTSVNNTDELVAYYREYIKVTDEVESYAADWGNKGDGSKGGWLDSSNYCTLSMQVVYEDGTTNPSSTSASDLKTKTMVYGYWPNGRGIGTVMLDGSDSYEIYKVSAETGAATASFVGNNAATVTDFQWDNNEQDVWEGEGSDSVAIHNNSNHPSKDGAYANLCWDENKEAILLRIYVRAKVTDDSLTVHYVDQTTQQAFYNYNIVVKQGTVFNENFKKQSNGLINNTVQNKLGITQTVQSDLKNMTEIGAQYRYGGYDFTDAVRSEDGKEVWLYYTFNNTHKFVADFGLPLTINAENLGLADTSWEKATVGKAQYGTIQQDTKNHILTYTANQAFQGIDSFTLTLFGKDEEGKEVTIPHTIYIYPATTVYYEENLFTTGDGSKWETIGSATDEKQTTSKIGDQAQYGYDEAYSSTASNSNNSAITSVTQGDNVSFTFRGTGFDLDAKCDKNSGYLLVKVTGANDENEKFMLVNTASLDGESDLTTYPERDLYNVPVISCTDLTYGVHKVTVTHADTKPVTLDGYKVYNTLLSKSEGDAAYSEYKEDLEENPSFIEVRDLNFETIDLKDYNSKYASDIYKQVYNTITDAQNCNAVISNKNENISVTKDLIDNGPKNEVYLHPGMSLTLNLETLRIVQLGLRGLQTGVDCTINGTAQQVSTTDMFYKIKNQGTTGTVTISNPEDSGSILAVTKLKVCDDPNALGIVSEDTVLDMLHNTGFTDPVPMADATANLNLVDYTGKTIASTSLTANGEQGTDATFTADQIKSAVTSALPEGYAVVDASKIADQTVKYGESADVNVQIGKVATLKVTYKKLFGKTVGTATLTGVQTSAGSKYSFSASEIKKAVPSGYWTIKLWGTKVKYGTTGTLTVNVF